MTPPPYAKNIDLPLDAIRAFCERHHIRRLALFGSVLRDDFRPDGDDPSDIDVLVEFLPGHTPGLEFFAMHEELAELLGIPVDFVTEGFLSPIIRRHVLREALTLYEQA